MQNPNAPPPDIHNANRVTVPVGRQAETGAIVADAPANPAPVDINNIDEDVRLDRNEGERRRSRPRKAKTRGESKRRAMTKSAEVADEKDDEPPPPPKKRRRRKKSQSKKSEGQGKSTARSVPFIRVWNANRTADGKKRKKGDLYVKFPAGSAFSRRWVTTRKEGEQVIAKYLENMALAASAQAQPPPRAAMAT